MVLKKTTSLLFVLLIATNIFSQQKSNMTVFAGTNFIEISGVNFNTIDVGANIELYKHFGVLLNVTTWPKQSFLNYNGEEHTHDTFFRPGLNVSYGVQLLRSKRTLLTLIPYVGITLPTSYDTHLADGTNFHVNPKNSLNYGAMLNFNIYNGFGVYSRLNKKEIYMGLTYQF